MLNFPFLDTPLCRKLSHSSSGSFTETNSSVPYTEKAGGHEANQSPPPTKRSLAGRLLPILPQFPEVSVVSAGGMEGEQKDTT